MLPAEMEALINKQAEAIAVLRKGLLYYQSSRKESNFIAISSNFKSDDYATLCLATAEAILNG